MPCYVVSRICVFVVASPRKVLLSVTPANRENTLYCHSLDDSLGHSLGYSLDGL